jgi:F-box domain
MISMETISDELLVAILRFVPPLPLLQSTSRVSKRFSSIIQSDEFWRTNPSSPIERDGFPKLTTHQIRLFHIFRFDKEKWRDEERDVDGIPPAFLHYGSILTTREEEHRCRSNLPAGRTCAASSTDHWNELVDNVLPNSTGAGANQEHQGIENGTGRLLGAFDAYNDFSWWSSRPSQDRNSSDTLLFCTNCPLALVSDVRIKALTDPYIPFMGGNSKIYTWNRTIVRAYRVPMEFLTRPNTPDSQAGFPCSFGAAQSRLFDRMLELLFLAGDVDETAARVPSDQNAIDALLENATLVQESVFDDTVVPSELKLALPAPVLANVITVTLVGKNFEQRQGTGYFACVESLDCTGIPLYLHPGQDLERQLDRN